MIEYIFHWIIARIEKNDTCKALRPVSATKRAFRKCIRCGYIFTEICACVIFIEHILVTIDDIY